MYGTTIIITNYKTLHLVKAAVESIRKFYAQIPMVVVDNGSNDDSTTYITELNDANTLSLLLTENEGHGPAMDRALSGLLSEWAWIVDSDVEILKPGLLEDMYAVVKDHTYAVGWLRHVNRFTGVPMEWHLKIEMPAYFIPYIHPCCALYNVAKYKQLKPFIHHGAPCLYNMIDAVDHHYGLVEFPVFNYIKHWVGGTRRMFSSDKGDWNPDLNDVPAPWNSNANVPI